VGSSKFLVQYYHEPKVIYVDLDAHSRHGLDDSVAAFLRRASSSYLFLTWELSHGKMLCAEFRLHEKFLSLKSNPPELALDLDWLALENGLPELRGFDFHMLVRHTHEVISD